MSDDRTRVIKEARLTVERLEDFPSETRVGALGPDSLEKWAAGMPGPSSPESGRPRFGSAPSAGDVRKMIDAAIAAEHEHIKDILVQLVAELRGESSDDMERAIRGLAIELGELRATVSELRLTLSDIRQKEPLDLPSVPFGRTSRNTN